MPVLIFALPHRVRWLWKRIASCYFCLLVQYGSKDYLFKINMDGTFDREQKLIGEFKQYLGQDANFQIEYVKEIPLLSSGKRKKIANTYHTSIATTSSQ